MRKNLAPRFEVLLACALLAALSAGLSSPAVAAEVGERHLVAHEYIATLRDVSHSDALRITVWYPAAPDAVETPLDIGPSFQPSSAAANAPFNDQSRRPVILFSHGFGGTARIMAWFGTALARHGYIVVAVDHPGNNGRDPMTVGGAVLSFERPRDLAAALQRVEDDPSIAPHLDSKRLGVAGFSAGGFTSLVAAGARVDMPRFRAFCAAHPDDGVCAPQKEFSFTQADAMRFLAQPEIAAEMTHAGDDFAVPNVKTVYLMAPALVQNLDPDSLKRLSQPVRIILGDADTVATPATNGEFAAKLLPDTKLHILPHVGHYDFLAECTPAGLASVPVCPTVVARAQTHAVAIEDAVDLFDSVLGRPLAVR